MEKLNHINHLSGALKRFALSLAVGAAVVFGVSQSAHAATLTYNFVDVGDPAVTNMQGWTSVFGTIWAKYDWWGSDGNIGDGWDAAEAQLAQSPEFTLDGSGDLTWQMIGTASPASAPTTNQSANISATAILDGGFMGVALRDVATDTYVLWQAFAGLTGPEFDALNSTNWPTSSFTAAQLAPYANDGRAYTLDFIDNDKFPGGGDHWVTLGGATIPGSLYIPPKDILSFTFPTYGVANITGTNITKTVPYGTVVTAMAPTYTVSPGATCAPTNGSTQNFTSPVHYIVTGPDSSTKDFLVTVNITPASSAKDILTFAVTGGGVSIAGTNITVLMLLGTDVTALAPTYTVSPFATGAPASGSVRNFTTPQAYTVTAQDSSTKDYLVTVQLVAFSGMVNVNFTGTARTGLGGPRGDSGESWNQLNVSFNSLAGGSNGALWDSAGVPTTIGVSYITDSTGLDQWGNPALQLIRDGLRNFPTASATGETLSITNLPAGRKYDVYIASANASGGESSDGVFSTTNTTTTVGDQPCVNTGVVNGTTWEQGNNYVLFANVVPDGTGTITMLGTNTIGFRLPVNGVQVVDVGPAVVASPIPTITGITGPVVGVFTINGSTDIAGNVVTLTTPSLSAPVIWTPLQTNAVPGGAFSFPVPQGAYPKQFYRLLGQ